MGNTTAYHFWQCDEDGNKYGKATLCFNRKLTKQELKMLNESTCIITIKEEFN